MDTQALKELEARVQALRAKESRMAFLLENLRRIDECQKERDEILARNPSLKS